MSRIGRKPIPIPQEVKVTLDGRTVRVEGPKGTLSRELVEPLTVSLQDGQVVVRRSSDERPVRALHGLTRSLLANMVQGVTQGFERKLEIVGIGFRAQLQGRALVITLGYSHPVTFPLPEGIQAEVEKQTLITFRGIDKALVGQTAASLRALRKPDPYKGKGVRYAGEVVRRKVGKKAGAR
ncbi:MAG: 50S ribosomal protein L6 [Candidatus Methylomirabilia bacterium]